MTHDGSQPGAGGSERDPKDVELSARLQRLEKRLGEARETGKDRTSSSSAGGSDPSAMGKAFRLSTEFIAGIIAGAGLGWGLDSVAGSRPWGMIVMTMLGFGAGIWNVMRASGFVRPPNRPGGDAGPGN